MQRKNLSCKVVAVALVFAPWLGCGANHSFGDGPSADAGQSPGGAVSDVPAGAGESAGGAADSGCALTLCAGICTDTAQDVEHCGTCDRSCTALPHLQTTEGVVCNSGVCAIPPSACASGYAHCSAVTAAGCETDISVPEHCGACTTSCGADAPFCALGKCSAICPKEAPTECDKSCADLNTDPMHCGDCATKCTQPASGGSVTCEAKKCVLHCLPGYHACDNGTCASDSDENRCEAACKVCPATANGAGQCSNNSCTVACNSGYHKCAASETCAADNDKNKCTAACTACADPGNGTAACSGNVCVTASCKTNFHQCPDSSCAGDTDVAHCTDTCAACPQAANAEAPTCVNKTCVTVCKPGFRQCSDGSCVDPSADPSCGGPLLVAGSAYACAIRTGGTVWCWGADTMATPTQISGLAQVAQLSLNGTDVCAVKDDHSIWCWGLSPATVPTDVSQQMKFLQVAGSAGTACAIDTSKNVYCLNGTWQKKGSLVATHLATDGTTTYARATDGTIWSWATGAAPAKQSAPAGTFAQLETAQEEVVYRTSAGAVVYVGQAGDTAINGSVAVGELTGATTFAQVSGGLRGACALASDGRVGCWGYGPYGQLGNGATNNTTAMVQFGGVGFKGLTVASGQLWTCALKSDHTVWCAGYHTAKDGVATQVGLITVP